MCAPHYLVGLLALFSFAFVVYITVKDDEPTERETDQKDQGGDKVVTGVPSAPKFPPLVHALHVVGGNGFCPPHWVSLHATVLFAVDIARTPRYFKHR